MKTKTNYNLSALMGMDVTDEDYRDSFGAPAEYVNTPKINTWMLDEVEKQNIQEFQKAGDTLKVATAKAAETKASVSKRIDVLMAQQGLTTDG